MKLIVGLGNTGTKYADTLHNIGWVAVEKLVAQANGTWKSFSKISEICQLNSSQAIILKPLTFMNESGRAVREIVDYFKITLDDLWVVHDELDLPPGEIRISFDASSAGHRGVQSLIESLSSQAWWRFRLGIGRPPTNIQADNFVLTKPDTIVATFIADSISKTVDLLKLALTDGIASASLKNKEK
ncbi:MAG: Peptidyl-tRNA hydrolase [Parcubacteria group bacterium GW2011_GWD2_43_10]|uniref:Peptidyl-tRNA hydrolase n=5 Tax=Candidatus Vebleniibacteriota TaxID=1817921 RepID=A0A1G2Q418_9BACT|nr:MAG: Peptidyl-tRNA hydrolase [Parcubacteria group bacterium GW2011_GWA2_42_80]KKS79569.1 MAG: Peptidyl-tRNA hydrolase [Parcubacteria group bacterium GW2011_GWD1_42_9]KKS81057.1 MAG: Peptidyl-tRNA hydrolase [Parcubacteria group bacterium GW2011_GWD2_43_10]KKS92679.1 MAG: Peptidyl-tRNA hydrolase [Parcubacteria group bacterium GW2011_GWE2_43_12]KKT13910.1 MAG: Peptidyl-tRNA hydrolase [Parcubacteria group bacterium GW2011_GWA1_43_27]KKT16048.1 MAG: Peptidyl-tRNA hydrolase [Parcubacteria group b